jgi:hypothetical protein
MRFSYTPWKSGSVQCLGIRFPLPFHIKSDPNTMRRQSYRHGWFLILLALFSGCIHVPKSSEITIEDRLGTIEPMGREDVLVVYGENAPVQEKDSMKSMIGSYVTAGCGVSAHPDTIGELIRTILKANPQPGRFAVRHAKDLETEKDPECTTTRADSILCGLNLTKARVLTDNLRYAIHVRENFEAKVHVPLYLPPFGIASCGNKTVLETTVWELSTEKCLGSFYVSAEGEYTVLAYLLHVVAVSDTQKDAMERLAMEIIERLNNGSKQAGSKN